jgi:adenine phosphoribosyltransferase
LCPLNDKIDIAAFVMFSDVELTVACAEELIKKCPECDIILTAESKGIPLAYEMARQLGKSYVVARKSVKLYMKNPISVTVKSITTAAEQTLFLSAEKAELIRGKKILVVDDVISTGESLKALEKLIEAAGGVIGCRAAVLAEGDAADRDDIVYLEKLPLFFK